MDEYTKYDNKPTLIWIAVIQFLAIVFFAVAVLFTGLPPTVSLLFFAVGLLFAVIALTIFIMTVVWPKIHDLLRGSQKYEDE